jgi:formylglycine-generating enzyme required for sulfatase activity
MKKIFTILTILTAVLLTTSCQKELPDSIKNVDVNQGGKTPTPTPEEKYVRASAESLSFTSPAGSLSFTISSNTSWSIKNDKDWCMVSSSSGSNNATLTVNVTENTSTSSRSATITISSTDAGSVKINVTQASVTPDLQLNKNNLSFTAAESNDSFTITSNISWSVTSDQTWCSVSTSSGSNNGTITVNVSENNSIDSRSASITVKAGDQSQSITVTQAGASPTLQLNKSSMAFESSNGENTFTISSNTSWSITSDKTWCTLSSSSGSNDATVTVYVSENTSTSSRSATITVESATIMRTLAVTQNGATPVTPPSSQDRSFTVGGVTFKMIAVEGGTFTMGGTSEQGSDAYDSEKPTHSVTLSSYSIGETEVTQALWQAVMGQKPTSDGSQWSSTYGLGGNYPAYYVSWNDCQDFIRRLNALTGENFRLPTEAEWEFAARGGNKSWGYKYAGSNNIDNVAWYYNNSYAKGENSSDYGSHNVATKSPNELGLYDMSGNVWEWCQDWYGSYSSGSQTNPTGPSSGSSRVRRGGSWGSSARGCRVSIRGYGSPGGMFNILGLRLAL